jgi:ribosomal protein L37AE/L43A
MLWTQSAWAAPDGTTHAAYQCDNGHVIDPAETAQCPNCGLHDTGRTQATEFKCRRCGNKFSFPR